MLQYMNIPQTPPINPPNLRNPTISGMGQNSRPWGTSVLSLFLHIFTINHTYFGGTQSGWWFETFVIFHFIYGMSSFPLTNSIHFSRWLKPPTSNFNRLTGTQMMIFSRTSWDDHRCPWTSSSMRSSCPEHRRWPHKTVSVKPLRQGKKARMAWNYGDQFFFLMEDSAIYGI